MRREDAQKREEVEVHNTADSAAYAAERLLDEHKERITDDVRDRVQSKVTEVRQALEQGAAAATLSALTAELSTLVQEIGQSMYAQPDADAGGANGAAGGASADDSETVEGEFREV